MRQRLFNGQLCLPIGVDRRCRMRFANRNLGGLAVHGAGGRKHELPAALGCHRSRGWQGSRPRCSDSSRTGSRTESAMRSSAAKCITAVAPLSRIARRTASTSRDVTFDKRRAQRGFPVSSRQVVEDHDAVTGSAERLRAMTADVARTAGHKNRAAVRAGSGAANGVVGKSVLFHLIGRVQIAAVEDNRLAHELSHARESPADGTRSTP